MQGIGFWTRTTCLAGFALTLTLSFAAADEPMNPYLARRQAILNRNAIEKPVPPALPAPVAPLAKIASPAEPLKVTIPNAKIAKQGRHPASELEFSHYAPHSPIAVPRAPARIAEAPSSLNVADNALNHVLAGAMPAEKPKTNEVYRSSPPIIKRERLDLTPGQTLPSQVEIAEMAALKPAAGNAKPIEDIVDNTEEKKQPETVILPSPPKPSAENEGVLNSTLHALAPNLSALPEKLAETTQASKEKQAAPMPTPIPAPTVNTAASEPAAPIVTQASPSAPLIAPTSPPEQTPPLTANPSSPVIASSPNIPLIASPPTASAPASPPESAPAPAALVPNIPPASIPDVAANSHAAAPEPENPSPEITAPSPEEVNNAVPTKSAKSPQPAAFNPSKPHKTAKKKAKAITPLMAQEAPEEGGISPESKTILSHIPKNLVDNERSTQIKPFSIQRQREIQDVFGAGQPATHEAMGIKIEVKKPAYNQDYELEKAYRAVISGQSEEAIEIYRDVLANDPNNKLALFGLATTYHKAGQLNLARPLYGRLLTIDPGNRDALNNFLALVADESPEKAVAQLEQLQLKNPGFSPILAQLAIIYEKLGQSDKAITSMNQAVEIAPENLAYRYNLAVLLDRKGDYANAEPLYRQILAAHDAGESIPGNLQKIQQRLTFISSNKH